MFGATCEQYHQYLSQKYLNTTDVFDGYASGPSTKDVTHIRRKRGIVSTSVRFTIGTPFRSNKDTFLYNFKNKQIIIYLKDEYLSERYIRHAESDADVLIVKTAIEYAETTTTFVIGEDTDLLIFFRSDRTKSKPKTVWDIHKTQSRMISVNFSHFFCINWIRHNLTDI